MSELIFVGGIDDPKKQMWIDNGKKLSRNYRQGNRVYSADGVANALTAQPIGGEGGNTGLYLVEESE